LLESEGFFYEPSFTFEMGSRIFDAEGFAENADGIGIGVHGAGDCGDPVPFLGHTNQSFPNDRFSGAGIAHHQAEPTLLAMDLECVEYILLLWEKQNRLM
jgi:hypothetical protein